MDPSYAQLFVVAAADLAIAPLRALGSRAHLWPWWLGFILCLASALLGLVLLLRLPWRYRNRTTNLWPDIWGIAPLLLPLLFLVQALRSPHQRRQHGSLPSATAPVGRAAQKPGGSPGLPALQVFPGNPGPLYTRASPVEVLAEAEELMTELGWQVHPGSEGIDAVVTTGWFGFQDDVALRVFAGPKETRIDMRSASRQGRSDLGSTGHGSSIS